VSEPIRLPFEQPDPMRPAPLLRELQAQGPIHAIRTAVGDPAWLVTGYEEVRAQAGVRGRRADLQPNVLTGGLTALPVTW
jgi:hypothetical protein